MLSDCIADDIPETNDLDWEYIYSFADQNKLIPLLAKSINNSTNLIVPEKLFNKINDKSREVIAFNIYKINELQNIQNQFNNAGIETILLKGPGLGETIYGDFTFRQFGDLDILVKKHQLEVASEILKNNGYEYYFALTEKQIKIYKKSPLFLKDHELHYTFYNTSKNIIIELHWALMPEKYSFSQNVDEMFDTSYEIIINNQTFNILSDEDCFIYLSQHGAKHSWSILLWVFDIANLINKKKNLNWELVIAKSEELNCKKMLMLSMYLANNMFSCDIPKVLLNYLKSDNSVSVLGEVVINNFKNGFDYKKIEAENKYFFLKSMESNKDTLLFLAGMVFKPTIYEFEAVSLPNNLSFLYYLVRPLRLIKKYILRVFSHN